MLRLPRAVSLDRVPALAPGAGGALGSLQAAAWSAGLRPPRPRFVVREALDPQLYPVEGVIGPEASFAPAGADHFLRLPNYVSERFVLGEGRHIAVTGIAKAVAAPGLGFIDQFNVAGGAAIPDELLADLRRTPDGFQAPERDVERVPGLSVPFCHYGLRAFGHFVLDGLLQIHLWERELLAGDARLVHWLFPDPWMQPALEACGIGPASQRMLQKPVALLERAGLSSALAAHGVYFPGPVSRRFFPWLRARFGAEAPASPGRLYVRRSESFGRRISNAAELEALAVRRGFSVLEPEGMGLADQIRTWAGAGTVLSAWGSTLTLAPLLAGPRQVVELLPDTVTDPWFYRQAVVHRLSYTPILHPAEPDEGITADLDAVDRALRALD